MKTIDEIKNEVALKHGYNDWQDLMNSYHAEFLSSYELTNTIITEAMQLYAEQMCKRQKSIDYIKANVVFIESSYLCPEGFWKVDKDSILNAPLATEE